MAKEYLDFFTTSYPGVETETNPDKPRRGAFNISLMTESEDKIEVWDGKSKGPPRKDKFPDKDELLKEIRSKHGFE